MTLDEKRQVIEVLLCAVIDPDPPGSAFDRRRFRTTNESAHIIGASEIASKRAAWEWTRACSSLAGSSRAHGAICLEAAYRLIESSPTLRREWFGR